MKSIKRKLYSIMVITFLKIVLIKNFVYADTLPLYGRQSKQNIDYLPLYYVAVITVIASVVFASIFILIKIYEDNKLEKNKESEEGVKNKDDN